MSFAKVGGGAKDDESGKGVALGLQFVGGNPDVEPEGAELDRRDQRPARHRSESVAAPDPAVTATSSIPICGRASTCDCASSQVC